MPACDGNMGCDSRFLEPNESEIKKQENASSLPFPLKKLHICPFNFIFRSAEIFHTHHCLQVSQCPPNCQRNASTNRWVTTSCYYAIRCYLATILYEIRVSNHNIKVMDTRSDDWMLLLSYEKKILI